jgi:hypothetical protein
LLMMVLTGGQERTEDQYRQLLASSGFSLDQVFRDVAPGGMSVLEARPL